MFSVLENAVVLVVKSDSSLAFDFPDLLKDNRQANGCVPHRAYFSALF